MQIKLIFIRMVSHLDSLLNRGTRELGNGLFSFHWNVSDIVVNGIGSNGNAVFFRLRLRQAYVSAYDSHFRFSLGYKCSYGSDWYSVASENQPYKELRHFTQGHTDNNLHFYNSFEHCL